MQKSAERDSYVWPFSGWVNTLVFGTLIHCMRMRINFLNASYPGSRGELKCGNEGLVPLRAVWSRPCWWSRRVPGPPPSSPPQIFRGCSGTPRPRTTCPTSSRNTRTVSCKARSGTIKMTGVLTSSKRKKCEYGARYSLVFKGLLT